MNGINLNLIGLSHYLWRCLIELHLVFAYSSIIIPCVNSKVDFAYGCVRKFYAYDSLKCIIFDNFFKRVFLK